MEPMRAFGTRPAFGKRKPKPPSPPAPPSEVLVEELVRKGAMLRSEAVVLEKAIRTGDHETVHRVLGLMDDRASIADAAGDRDMANATRHGRVVLAKAAAITPPPAAPEPVAMRPVGGGRGPLRPILREAPIAGSAPVPGASSPALAMNAIARRPEPAAQSLISAGVGRGPVRTVHGHAVATPAAPVLGPPSVGKGVSRLAVEPLARPPGQAAPPAINPGVGGRTDGFSAPALVGRPILIGSNPFNRPRRPERAVMKQSAAVPVQPADADRQREYDQLPLYEGYHLPAGTPLPIEDQYGNQPIAADRNGTLLYGYQGDPLRRDNPLPRPSPRVRDLPPTSRELYFDQFAEGRIVQVPDVRENPLEAPLVVGRRTINEGLQPFSFEELAWLGNQLTVEPIRTAVPAPLPEELGADDPLIPAEGELNPYSVGFTAIDPTTGLPIYIVYDERLNDETNHLDRLHAVAHEVGHAVYGFLARPGENIFSDMETQLADLYNEVNTPGDRNGDGRTGPEDQPEQYRPDERERELFAEAFRIYVTQPNWLWTHYPEVADAIATRVNSDADLQGRIWLQMN